MITACSIGTAVADTFTVKNTDPSGTDSLGQAIIDANGHPNINMNTPDMIVFAIPASDPNRNPATGVFTITPPVSGLPGITDSVIIDGYTQGGAKTNTLAIGNNAVLLIELSGADAGSGISGLNFKAGSAGSTVRGMVINRFANTNGFAAAGITHQHQRNNSAGQFYRDRSRGRDGVRQRGGHLQWWLRPGRQSNRLAPAG